MTVLERVTFARSLVTVQIAVLKIQTKIRNASVLERRGDAVEAKKNLSRLFSSSLIQKISMVAEEAIHGRRIIKVTTIHIHGTQDLVLMDSEAIKNVSSKSFKGMLSIVPEETSKSITVATGVK